MVTRPCSSSPTATPSAKAWKGSGCNARSDNLASAFQVSNSRNSPETRCPTSTTSEAAAPQRQDSSGIVMNPTPGKSGCSGPSSSATKTPKLLIAVTVPERISPRSNDPRNPQSSGLTTLQSTPPSLPQRAQNPEPPAVRHALAVAYCRTSAPAEERLARLDGALTTNIPQCRSRVGRPDEINCDAERPLLRMSAHVGRPPEHRTLRGASVRRSVAGRIRGRGATVPGPPRPVRVRSVSAPLGRSGKVLPWP